MSYSTRHGLVVHGPGGSLCSCRRFQLWRHVVRPRIVWISLQSEITSSVGIEDGVVHRGVTGNPLEEHLNPRLMRYVSLQIILNCLAWGQIALLRVY